MILASLHWSHQSFYQVVSSSQSYVAAYASASSFVTTACNLQRRLATLPHSLCLLWEHECLCQGGCLQSFPTFKQLVMSCVPEEVEKFSSPQHHAALQHPCTKAILPTLFASLSLMETAPSILATSSALWDSTEVSRSGPPEATVLTPVSHFPEVYFYSCLSAFAKRGRGNPTISSVRLLGCFYFTHLVSYATHDPKRSSIHSCIFKSCERYAYAIRVLTN